MMVAKAPRFVEPGGSNGSPSWKALHAVADKAYPGLVDALQAAVKRARGAVNLRELSAVILADPQAALDQLRAAWTNAGMPGLQTAMQRTVSTLLAEGGAIGQLELMALLPEQEVLIESAFNRLNDAAAVQAETIAGQRIAAITEETLRAVREVLSRAFREGVGPDETARQLRQVVGLTERQAQSLLNYQDSLAGSGLSLGEQRRLVQQRAEALIARRAEVIARTETITAAQAGQQQLWEIAGRAGILPEGFRRFWLVTFDDRLCPFCQKIPGLNPEGRTLNEPFQTPGGSVMTPAAHPQCRCAVTARMVA